jgi:hypothetical protein
LEQAFRVKLEVYSGHHTPTTHPPHTPTTHPFAVMEAIKDDGTYPIVLGVRVCGGSAETIMDFGAGLHCEFFKILWCVVCGVWCVVCGVGKWGREG